MEWIKSPQMITHKLTMESGLFAWSLAPCSDSCAANFLYGIIPKRRNHCLFFFFFKATSPISCKLIFYRYNYLIKLCNYISSTTGINRIGNKYRWILALTQWKTKAVSILEFLLPITGLLLVMRPWMCAIPFRYYIERMAALSSLWNTALENYTWVFCWKCNGCKARDVFQIHSSQWQLAFFFFYFTFFFFSSSLFLSQYRDTPWEHGFNRPLDFMSLLLSSKMQKQNWSYKLYGERVLFLSSWVERLHESGLRGDYVITQAVQTSVVWHNVSTNVYTSRCVKKTNTVLSCLGTPWLSAPFAQGPLEPSTGRLFLFSVRLNMRIS